MAHLHNSTLINFSSEVPGHFLAKVTKKLAKIKMAASKSSKKAAPANKQKKKRSRCNESLRSYIFKVLKQVHPNTGISSKAISIMNLLVNDIFERIASEASRFAHYNKRSTIRTAFRLLLPGELAKHSVSEESKAAVSLSPKKEKASKIYSAERAFKHLLIFGSTYRLKQLRRLHHTNICMSGNERL